MSKAVMISIRPKWCEKIASGEKTIEVRKTRPKLETPFKCYIYCTVEMAGYDALWVLDAPTREKYSFMAVAAYLENPKGANKGNGKVIGEFVCEEIVEIDGARRIQSDVARPTCLEPAELHKYLGVAVGYGWHISNLKVYDEPKELGEFKGLCKVESDCCACPYYNYSKMDCDGRTIKRPPQSWCYVEATKDV